MKWTLLLLTSLLSQSLIADPKDKEPCFTKLSEVLSCFIRHNDGVNSFQLLSTQKENDITIETYVFESQKWPIEENKDIPTTVWKHKLVLYTPDKLSHNTALLYVGGGYVRNAEGKDQDFIASKEHLDFKSLAHKNNALIVDLQDVPNQSLPMDGSFKREDQIVASTYEKVMKDPLKNAYLAGHLPMVKAVVKAMDLVQKLKGTQNFVLTGLSKRGWAVWLTALEDNRVQAIIPIVIDILNTQKSIVHICKVYGECPYAIDKDYSELTHKLNSPELADLMKIEDPFSYLGADYDPKYKERLAIPKLIITASGDDFFVPDSSQWFLKELPGSENFFRVLPNSMHYFRGFFIADSTQSLESANASVDSFFDFLMNKTALPKLQWSFEKNRIDVKSSSKPAKVKLWTAFNEKNRDFRYLNEFSKWWLVKKWQIFKKYIRHFFSMSLCDTCYYESEVEFHCSETDTCKIEVPLLSPKTPAWRAAFVELHYEIEGRSFILSTEVSIEHVSAEKTNL